MGKAHRLHQVHDTDAFEAPFTEELGCGIEQNPTMIFRLQGVPRRDRTNCCAMRPGSWGATDASSTRST